LFVANRAMNRVEVLSIADGTHVARITIPGASSADLSADGATVWVGTVTEQVVAIDTTSLQVRARYAIQPLSVVPNESYGRPKQTRRQFSYLRREQSPILSVRQWCRATRLVIVSLWLTPPLPEGHMPSGTQPPATSRYLQSTKP
jgi:hypothetical protein